MIDATTLSITEYIQKLHYDQLPATLIDHCKNRIMDTIGCALAAFDAGPVQIARKMATRSFVVDGATILGTRDRTLPELAAFSNSKACVVGLEP